MKFISTVQAASVLDLNRSRIKVLCAQKRIKGAVKIGSVWCIPSPPIVLPPKRK
jgi:hypothetical protein